MYSSLTDEQIRKTVAERLGWKWYQGYIEQHKYAILTKSYRAWEQVGAPDDDADALIGSDCPNWPGNIADAYQLEESVPEEGRERYAEILAGLIDAGANTSLEEGEVSLNVDANVLTFCYALAHATPRQRCEAWLMLDDERRGR